METKDELKEMLINNAASWGKKEGDDMAEIYVDDFLNELLSKFKLLPIPVVSDMLTVKEVLDILDDSDHLDDAKTLIRETVS